MDNNYQYYKSGSSLPRSNLFSSIKPSSTKEFLERFKKLPSYNAIHSKIKPGLAVKLNHRDHNSVKQKISFSKLFKSCQKRSSMPWNEIRKERTSTNSKKLMLKILVSNKRTSANNDLYNHLKIKLKNRRQRKSNLLMGTDQKEEFSKKQRLSLRSQQQRRNSYEFGCVNRQIQRKSYQPLHCKLSKKISSKDDEPREKDFYETNQPVVELRSKYDSGKRLKILNAFGDDSHENGIKNRSVYQEFLEKQNPRLDLSHSKQTQKNELKKTQSSKRGTKYSPIQTQTPLIEKENLPRQKQKINKIYIKNFIKTANILSEVTNLQKYSNEKNGRKSPLLKADMIAILHPEGQFSKDFQYQFNPW